MATSRGLTRQANNRFTHKFNFTISIPTTLLILLLSSFSWAQASQKVLATGNSVDVFIKSDSGAQFRIVTKQQLLDHKIFDMFDEPDQSLVLGLPLSLIGQRNIFGGVIVAVTDNGNENLGNLKLADLPPAHVKTVLSENKTELYLRGCARLCDETSAQENLFTIPVIRVDNQYAYLDIKAFGSKLEFFKELGDDSMQADNTEVKRFEYNLSTLVFDVENTYNIPTADENLNFKITTRWYLKLSSGLSNHFSSRAAKDGVGFFTTARNKNTLITRFSIESGDQPAVKYFIKNVPTEYRQAFRDSFEDWNTQLRSILNKDLFTYEFLETSDPRYNEIIAGDVRYNVLEWDITNVAGYGGLGPSIASQVTGEIFSANTLIQGPKVLVLYKKWWRVSDEVDSLINKGLIRAAEELKLQYLRELQSTLVPHSEAQLSLGKMFFKIHSADPKLADPALDATDFLQRPVGFNFETYLYGYFRDMVTHEIGHNIGLRHNFKGNLGASNNADSVAVSRSIMEYLDRENRHLNRVGAYDKMAVAYGYLGVEPAQTDWYCTDEDQPSSGMFFGSAECSSSDASSDPYGLLLTRLNRVFDFLLLPGSELAPVWDVDVLSSQITPILNNLANYYYSSRTDAKNWTNFKSEKRSVSPDEAPRYIMNTIALAVCNNRHLEIISKKTTEGQTKARKNLGDFKKLFKDITSAYKSEDKGLSEEYLPCLSEESMTWQGAL